MNAFTHATSAHFTRSRLAEAVAEVVVTAAAAGFTAAIWLSIGAWAIVPGRSMEAVAASAPPAAQHITLPTVVIVGRRDSLEGTPVTTTAQNTAANPITLRQ